MLEKRDLELISTMMDEKLGRMDEKFEKIDERFGKIDERFGKIDERFGKIDERFERIDERFDRIDERFDRIDARFQETDKKIVDEIAGAEKRIMDKVEQKLDTLSAMYSIIKTETETIDYLIKTTDGHEERISRIEAAMA